MKTSHICVLLVVGLFGRVYSRVASDLSVITLPDNDVHAACRHEAVPNTIQTLPVILLTKQADCIKPSIEFLIRLATAADTNAYRSLFRSACTQEVGVRSCITDVSVEASPCLNDMEYKMFGTVKDYIENSITAVCANGSEVIARMYGDERKLLDFNSRLAVLSCINDMKSKTTFREETDLPAFTLRRYRGLKEMRRCVLNVAREANREADWFDRFMGPLVDTSKCIDAVTHEVVLCKKLEPEQDGQH